MAQNIVIYQDEGVGEFGVKCLQKFFKNDDVWLANAEAIIDGRVLHMADIFVIPGGADLPYCKKLNGEGNDNIRAYVEDGGTYLGICAGAYYACNTLKFHEGREDEITGKRELDFANAVAVGSLPELAPYYDLTVKSAAAANIRLPDDSILTGFYHGGPKFNLKDDSANIIARYEDIQGKPPAIIETYVGDGRTILLGVHLEMIAQDLLDFPMTSDEERKWMEPIIKKIESNPLNPQALLSGLLKGAIE